MRGCHPPTRIPTMMYLEPLTFTEGALIIPIFHNPLKMCVSLFEKNIICVVNAKVSLYNQLYVTNMYPFHVSFKATSCNAWKFADCASLRLFPRVGHFVLLKIVWSSWRIVTLIAQLRFFSSVRHNVDSRISTSIGWIVALCAPVLLLSSVGE